MAGNPFRKSQFLSLDVSAAREAAGLETSQSQAVATSTTTKGKSDLPAIVPALDKHSLRAR